MLYMLMHILYLLDMLIHMLAQAIAPNFLLSFMAFSAVCIIGGWVWATNADGSKKYPLPKTARLNLYEIAALRDGRKGVIQTALFLLWHNKRIEISGKGRSAARFMKGESRQPAANPLEEAVYNFVVSAKRKPGEFFNPSSKVSGSLEFHSKIDELLGPVNQTLEELHLIKSDKSEFKQAWKAFLIPLALIFDIGCTKLYLDISHHRPVGSLILLLIVMAIISIHFLKPRKITWLGRRYQKKLAKPLTGMIPRQQNKSDPGFDVAVFGMTALAGIAAFSPFGDAFSMTAGIEQTGGGGGGSGDGSDGGGCGGGGCGGGGCGG